MSSQGILHLFHSIYIDDNSKRVAHIFWSSYFSTYERCRLVLFPENNELRTLLNVKSREESYRTNNIFLILIHVWKCVLHATIPNVAMQDCNTFTVLLKSLELLLVVDTFLPYLSRMEMNMGIQYSIRLQIL